MTIQEAASATSQWKLANSITVLLLTYNQQEKGRQEDPEALGVGTSRQKYTEENTLGRRRSRLPGAEHGGGTSSMGHAHVRAERLTK